MHKQTIIDWCYSDFDGYNEKKELAALRKLLKASNSFEDAKFTYDAAFNCNFPCFDVLKGALLLASESAKTYNEHLWVMLHSEYGTPQYEKAIDRATKKAACQYDMELIGKINLRKSRKSRKEESNC